MTQTYRQTVYTGTEPPPENLALDSRSLEEFLRPKLDVDGELQVEKFKGGQSNPTYKLTSRAGSYVLRRRPPGVAPGSAHAIDREYRVISALSSAGLPVPTPYLYCRDLDIIGSEFFIAAFVPGRIFWDADLPCVERGERSAIYANMNDLLARIHDVNYAELGLGDFGPSAAYVVRNLQRWTASYQSSKLIDIPDMDWLAHALAERMPKSEPVTLMHGDFGIYNLILSPDGPVIDAALDWELSTLGNPFVDLAHNLRAWWDIPHAGGATSSLRGHDLASLGVPTMEEYIEGYCHRRGISSVVDMSFYLGFAQFRYAAMIQGILRRASVGTSSSRTVLHTQDRVVAVAAMARKTVEGA